jgi:hypothetical protein
MGRSLPFLALVAIMASPVSAKRVPKYTAAQFDSWAACAIEKNNDEIIWTHALNSGDIDNRAENSKLANLSGAALYGAKTYSVIILGRDCAPQDVRMDNDYFDGLVKAIGTRWTANLDKRSQPRPMDKWTDCVVDKYRQLAMIYLAASDSSVAGIAIAGEGIDPHKAIFDATPDCNVLRDASQPIDYLGVYSHINFRMRIAPRLKHAAVDASKPDAGVAR